MKKLVRIFLNFIKLAFLFFFGTTLFLAARGGLDTLTVTIGSWAFVLSMISLVLVPIAVVMSVIKHFRASRNRDSN